MNLLAWGWPQWTILALMFFHLAIHMSSHGEERPGFNGGAALFRIVIYGGFLWMGGFWP